MKAVKIILGIIGVLVAIFLILGLVAPKETKVERSISIAAPHSVIHPYLVNLEMFEEWSPWAELDTNMERSYEGTLGQVGSIAKWKGNKDVGTGSQEILAITDNKIDIKLRFLEPWESESDNSYLIAPDGEMQKVTWVMNSKMPFPWNAMGFFMNLEEMVGKDFEKGLAKLKTVCESKANTSFKISEGTHTATQFAIIRKNIPMSEMGAFFDDAYARIYAELGKSKINPSGNPYGIYFKWDEGTGKTDCAAAVPVDFAAKLPAGLSSFKIETGNVILLPLNGPYSQFYEAHTAIYEYMNANKKEMNGVTLEEYVKGPVSEPDSNKWVTNIFYQIK